jgi:hypothetical protein
VLGERKPLFRFRVSVRNDAAIQAAKAAYAVA